MAASCPNKNHPIWKELVERYNEDLAYYAYDRAGETIPELEEGVRLIEAFVNPPVVEITKEPSEKAQKKIGLFKRFLPHNINVINDYNLTTPGSYDPNTRTMSFNPTLLDNEIVGHEFGHILLHLMNGMQNPRIKNIREMFRGHPLEARVLKEYEGKYKDPESYDLEIVAQVLGKEVSRLFDEQEKRSKLERLLMYIYEWFRAKLGLERNDVRRLARMMLTNKVIKDNWEVRKEEDEAPKGGEDVYLSLFSRGREKEMDIYEELAREDEGNVENLSTLQGDAIEVIERKLKIYRSKGSRVPINQAKDYLQRVKDAKSPEEALFNFVELAYNSTKYIHEDYKIKKHNNDITINSLEYWKNYVNGFGLINHMSTALYGEYQKRKILDKEKVESRKTKSIFTDVAFKKMEEVKRMKDDIVNAYMIEGSAKLAEYLAPHYKHLEIRLKDRLTSDYQLESKEYKEKVSLDDYINKQLGMKEDSLRRATIRNIRAEILKAGRDISQLTRWLDTIIDSSDPVVSAMVHAFTDQDVKARREILDMEYELIEHVNELEKFYSAKGGVITDPRKLYDFMLEKNTKGKHTGYILGERKGGFEETLQREISKFRETNPTEVQISTFIGQWYKANGVMDWAGYENALFTFLDTLPVKGSRLVTHEEIQRYKNAHRLKANPYVISLLESEEGEDITDPTKAIHNPEILEQINWWIYENKSKFYTVNSNWINKDFANLKKILDNPNDPRTKFYNFIAKTSFKLQRGIPISQRIGSRLPAILKDADEYIVEGKVKTGFKEEVRKKLGTTYEEQERVGGIPGNEKIRLVDEEGNPVQFIPVLYNQPITDKEGNLRDDISLDLGTSFFRFFRMAIDYRHKREILPQMEMARWFVNNRQYIELDENGNPYIDALDPTKRRKSTTGGKTSHLAAQLNDWLKSVFYGMREEEGTIIPRLGLNIAKGINLLNSYTALNMLGLNVVQGTANTILGHANDWIEAFGGIHYNPKDFVKADVYYTTHLLSTLGDIGQRKPNGIVNLLNDLFDTLHEYEGGKMRENNMFQRLFKLDTMFATTHLGEHMIQSKVMLAMLNHMPAYNKKGEKIGTILDMYRVSKNKRLEFKEEFDPIKSKWTEQDQKDFHFRLGRTLADLHGDYYRNSIPAFQRLAIGRMAGLFRKFVVPGWKRRWEGLMDGKHPDTLRNAMVEGYYATFLRFIGKFAKDLVRVKVHLMSEDIRRLTPTERANIRRCLTEIAFLIGSIGAITMFTSIQGNKRDDEDEEESWLLDFVSYQSYRFMAEMSFFFNPKQTMNILRSPAASITMVENAIQLFGQTLDFVDGSIMERYERGNWKGHLKIEKYATNLFAPGYKQWYRLKYVNDQINWFK